MQASEGISLEAQQGAIRQYRELHGPRPGRSIRMFCLEGKRSGRDSPGWLRALQHGAGVLVVVKFDRLAFDPPLLRDLARRTSAMGEGAGRDP